MEVFLYHEEGMALVHRLDVHPDPADFPIHFHGDYELYCFVSGKARYAVEGRIWQLVAGTVLLIRPGESHRFLLDGDEPYERYVLNFTADAVPAACRHLLDFFSGAAFEVGTFYAPHAFHGVQPLDLLRTLCRGEAADRETVCALLCGLLAILKSSAVKPTERISNDGIKMVDYVNQHLLDPLPVAAISNAFHMSVAQAERVFKTATGTGIGHYIKTKRLLRAKVLITEGATAERAARRCGFSDYSAFYRLYKKQFGHAPSDKDRATR